MNLLLIPVGLLYLLISGTLFIFGANFIYLSVRTLRDGRSRLQPPKMTHWPQVTVQLPIYNEMYVAERVIRAAAKLDYPVELLQIQVLDDSTDETRNLVQRTVARLQAQGINIVHQHRSNRSGYKAGALQAGLATASGEFIAIFDADFVPPPEFLRKALPYVQEPDVAFVQTRWGHLNRDYSWLTFLQSLAIDAHFMVEQYARSRAGYWFNFNGTAGIWRREAMLDAGGWTADTLTEDLDLSYRAYLRGWRGQYVRDIVVPAELPVSFSAYRRQQHRWARGSLECAKKLGPQVWRAPIPLSHKFQASLHLGGYSVHLLLFALTLIYPLVAFFTAQYIHLSTLYGLAYLFALTSFAPTLFFISGQQQLGRPWWRLLPKILAISVVGSGLMMNSVRAAWQIVRKRENVFERTAKFGIEQNKQDWTQQRYQLRFDPIVYPELLLGLYSLFAVWLAVNLESWGIAFYALLFGSGLILVALVTIKQTTAVYRSRRARAARQREEQEWAVGTELHGLSEPS
ncbi:MAG: glycosyltransferase [Chloroflexi bacterium]|jgi:cellulose synthase/poly-beta-1,6-N-acetylglucosamine synthase-like glycosyltransferase|nr:glycosyltransferase [Chloroflexota bacterium]